MRAGKVYFVGAGPGAPDLITVRGQRILQAADFILYTGSLVPAELFEGLDAEVRDSKGLDIEQIVALLVEHLERGERVARVHTGDPGIYGAVQEQQARLKAAGWPWEVVPGVTAATAAAAAASHELTLPGLSQTVVISRTEGRTPMPEGEKLADLGRLGGATLCLYLSASLTEKVSRELIAAGRPPDTPVVVVQYASMGAKQRILRCRLEDLHGAAREAGIRAQAMLLIGPALDPAHKERVGAFDSRLYAADFSHRFRRGARGGAPSAPRTPRGDRFEAASTLSPKTEDSP